MLEAEHALITGTACSPMPSRPAFPPVLAFIVIPPPANSSFATPGAGGAV